MENDPVIVIRSMGIANDSTAIRSRPRAIFGCALTGSLGIIILDTLVLKYSVYYSDNILILYPVAVHSLWQSLKVFARPLEYLIILIANSIYLPLWLGVSLLCTVAATILAALTCERMFERRLPETGWWVLGFANPLLFYLVSQPILAQSLANVLFAGAMFAFVSEFNWLRSQPPRGWRGDRVALFLNLTAAALFFTKETAVAAAAIIPAATALARLKARQLSPLFLFSLLIPIGAGSCWVLLKVLAMLSYQGSMFPGLGGGRYDLKLNPLSWAENFIITLAFPVTPLPSSLLEFALFRPLWILVALGSVVLFIGIVLRASLRQPKIVLPLLVIAASCAPMILVRTSELYPSMIAPFAVSIVLLCGLAKRRWLSLSYGLLLYAASFANGVIFWSSPDLNLFGLQHLNYSIYGKDYQIDPICPIGTTAHVAWDGTAVNDLFEEPGVKGRVTCIR